MRIDIMTLFPETVNAVLHESIIGRAAAKGIVEINCVQIRDFTDNKQMQVDDYPYGGGWGCVMMAQPLKACLESIMQDAGQRRSRVIYLSPQGQPYTQATAKRLKKDYDHLVLVCGHYEGIDERFIEQCVDEEISLGDFVLTGGEIAAMAVADSVCRLVPGVLADEQCYTGESHWDGLLEYPQYTRPENWEGHAVPDVLLRGDHAKVEIWRRKQQLLRTKAKRPDMFNALQLTDKRDLQLIKEIEAEAGQKKITEPVKIRTAGIDDLPTIAELANCTEKRTKTLNLNPERFAAAEKAIQEGSVFALLHGNERMGYFMLSSEPKTAYAGITDGKWADEEPYTVLEAAILFEAYSYPDSAEHLMRQAESLTRAVGRKRLRIDLPKKNKDFSAILRGCGYRYRGNIHRVSEVGKDIITQAYEKMLKDK